ncbi:MAG TPA: UDP-N-acetylglucosamine 1-carboxyvinyltransferase [Anaerolineaceae bacterium]|uniref:UDP-N-acetylglucosamine 1-carboxyvinyltransferase n=1 Tax=Anaerolinea thermophila TaxID=167964 RepID=A0A101FYM5_9CHLR|nr:MAG: UDP-N-acetylglucosamine 1-carboxyvinyltransferase [Anaerolinea thermophila]HAF61607.1 UDP-N-acetylglucosamine 1-carboxyvinyltransferase [Anaerolineaceae bacterium]
MDKFIIEGGVPLNGEVTPSGNKNAALPILAACILTDQPVVLHNIPDILDVHTMRALLESLGVKFKSLDAHTWEVWATEIHPAELDPELCRNIRASILLAGPMLARAGYIILPPPGGDVIGRRRVDTHILALQKLGVELEFNRSFTFRCKELVGADILLDEASVTATENAIMASVLARGTTILRNAASEPHIQELCLFLNNMGAKIKNIGSNTLEIEGVTNLAGGEFTIGPDYLEVVSFIGASAITKGSITIKNAAPQSLSMVKLVFNRMGVDWNVNGEDILVPSDQCLCIEPDLDNAIPTISVMPWPSFPTDLMSIAIVVATQSKGTMLFHDWMYPSRMFFTDRLVSMGAQIVLCDPHRCIVQGPTRLLADDMAGPDIRAGMALLLAALSADGVSTIRNIGQIDRGYEKIDRKLAELGASIKRC